jgi:hypothetical protein
MFRKTWKTIKILLIIIVILICVPHSLLPKKESKNRKNELKTQPNEQSISRSNTSISDTIPKSSLHENASRAK